MPKNTANQIHGCVGESRLIVELEEQGFPVSDISGRDFGLDLSLMVPERPLTAKEVTLIKKSEQIDSYEVSAQFIHVQVKSTASMYIERQHLAQWASAIDKGSIVVLVFVRSGYIEIFPPHVIREAYSVCIEKTNNSVCMDGFGDGSGLSNRKAVKISTEITRPANVLGLFMYSLLIADDIALDLEALFSVRNEKSFLSFLESHNELLKDVVFDNYAPGRDLDEALASPFDGVSRVIQGMVTRLKKAFGLECCDTSVFEENFRHQVDIHEYQGPKYTENQKGENYFREVPACTFQDSIDVLIKIIESGVNQFSYQSS
ncbi:hypothetical protein QP903_02485 [Corynebacterium pseudodiphtheriticum]|uniref:hypothetical protein n=1 Tax=Corynebacterium pseudodiphtheriticum TaxID=37637 RepID=UPI00254B7C83|nr:hypothetical protein [Corynebacterium pseudodiphtheriticum]MDK8545199.1 hypothetical protein [Corynebacterium pseudodiphtheriticum]